MIDNRIKIMMLKGEKGDTYDDTELRAEINAKLANTPYIGYTEDGTFELPLHTIDDTVTDSGSTWSSEKIDDITTNTMYTVADTSATTATCNLTYSEVLALITSNNLNPELFIEQSESMAVIRHHIIPDEYQAVSARNSYISIKGNYNNYAYTIMHYSNDNISVTWTENEDYSSEIADLQESNDELQAKKWISLGSVDNDGVEIPFTSSANSTILVMTCSATAQDGNSLFLCRKTMAGASGWKLSDLGLDVTCIIHSSGNYIYVYPDSDIGNIAVYYQVIE